MDNENKKYIELEEENAVIRLPANTVKLKVECEVYDGEKIVSVSKAFEMSDVRRAFQLAEEYFDDPDERYALTEEGIKYLNQLTAQLSDSERPTEG